LRTVPFPEPLSPVMITSSVLGTLAVFFIASRGKPACQPSGATPAHSWSPTQAAVAFCNQLLGFD
jgi:hypothetical protein